MTMLTAGKLSGLGENILVKERETGDRYEFGTIWLFPILK